MYYEKGRQEFFGDWAVCVCTIIGEYGRNEINVVTGSNRWPCVSNDFE